MSDETTRFPSAESLRVAHSELLKHFRTQGEKSDMITEVEGFIRRGRATGALLDSDADRWATQSLLDYWATQLYKPGYEPPDATLAEFDPLLAPELDESLCPYLGLDAFHESNQNIFFGRQRLIHELSNKLTEVRFLAVVGSSGSGKSSVVRAGLIPKLRTSATLDNTVWEYFAPMVPGSNPLENLARLMMPQDANTAQVKVESDLYRQDSTHLAQIVSERFHKNVMVVVDQFEEIFTLCTDEVARQRFVENLINITQAPNAEHRVIITMRADFESNVVRLPDLQAAFEQGTVRITPLTASELREAIEEPAALIGLKFEEGVVNALLNDTLGEPAALPLLQFTLLKLWESRVRNRVTWEAYKKLGGGRQALARSADEFYNRLIPEEQMTMRRILLKMVRPGEGLEITSNRVPRSALYQKSEANDRIDRVLGKLIQSHLIRFSDGDIAADEQVEVTHEALLRNWPHLVEWLEEERVRLRQRQRLTAAAEEWQRLGQDPSALWRGTLLEEARLYNDLSHLEKKFIQAGRTQQYRWGLVLVYGLSTIIVVLLCIGAFAVTQSIQAKNSDKTAIAGMKTQSGALANEKNALETALAESTKVAIAQITATAYEGLAGVNAQKAQEEAIRRLSAELSAKALSVVDTNYSQGLLLGVESFRLLKENKLAQGKAPDTLPQLLEKVPTGLMGARMSPPFGVIRKIVYSPNGNLVVTLSDTTDVWDTSDPLSPVLVTWNSGMDIKATDVTFSSDGSNMVVGYADGHVELWTIAGSDITKASTLEVFSKNASSDVKVAVSKDKSLLGVAGNGTILIYDISGDDQPVEIGHVSHPHEGKEVEYLWFDPNYQNSFLVSGGGDGSFHVWDLRKDYTPMAPYRSIPRHHGVADIAINSEYVIIAGEDSLYISSSFSKFFTPIKTIAYSDYHHGLIQTMMINSSSTRLYTAGQDGVIVEWDITDPYRVKFVKVYSGDTSRVSSAAFHPSGKFIISGGDDSKLISWDIGSESIPVVWRSVIRTDSPITDIAYAPNKNLLAVGEESGLVVLWDITNPSSPSIRYRHFIRVPIAHVAFSPDETAFMFLSAPTEAYSSAGYLMEDLNYFLDPRKIFELNTADIFVGTGSYVLAGEIGDSTLKIFQWNVEGKVNREHDPILVDACPFRDYAYAGRSDLVAIATCNLQLWNFPDDGSPSLIREFGSSNPLAVDLSRGDGTLLASANADNTFSLWRIPSSGDPQILSTKDSGHLTPVDSVSIDSSQRVMATGGDSPSVVYWNITDPSNPIQRFVLNGHTSKVLNGGVFFSLDGDTLISASRNEVILWDVDPASWIEKACRIAGRNFTQTEWKQFVGGDIPYHLTCPEFSAPVE